MRLSPPDPPLADDLLTLEPLTQAHMPAMLELVQDDQIMRYTRVPDGADEAFVASWIGRYESGWSDGSRAGFAVLDGSRRLLAFAAFVQLDGVAAEGEIGYAVGPSARGRGVATRALELLTRWGFDQLELARIELLIDVENAASARVAERAGYHFEGVLRSKHFKNGRRADLGVWSRLRSDDQLT